MARYARYSRKDYELVAMTLKDASATFTDDASKVALAHVAGRFASTFQIDNTAFDLERFVTACGVTKE